MENKSAKLGTTAFLILLYSSVEENGFFKYLLLAITTISFIITAAQLYEKHRRKNLAEIDQENEL